MLLSSHYGPGYTDVTGHFSKESWLFKVKCVIETQNLKRQTCDRVDSMIMQEICKNVPKKEG